MENANTCERKSPVILGAKLSDVNVDHITLKEFIDFIRALQKKLPAIRIIIKVGK